MLKQGINSNGEFIRNVYVEHEAVDLDASHDGMCRQEFADECDINVLMATYEKTGVLNHFNRATPQFLDVSEIPDLQLAMEVLHNATDAFMTLPAVVRREFDNDAVKFVEYAQDPKNVERMREWGLARPAPVEDKPIEVRVMNEPPAESGLAKK